MPALKFCRSCAGPRPRAAIRCPWCLKAYQSPRAVPEHLFSTFDGEARGAGPAPDVREPSEAGG